ncbi:YutD-like domain-containing protein, partial [Paenibacillus sp. GCM10023252]|uniref:YutD family protein n=1 Tax=Paenibacillus sp. GCM10023252 TaxID=3252649 RepID=UPI0036152CFE
MGLIQIGGKAYELVHENKNGWNAEAFRERYSEVLERYDYIIGDWGYSQLRLKGFFKEQNSKATKESTIAGLVDYINEYCNFGCAFFVLERAHSSKRLDGTDDSGDGEAAYAEGDILHLDEHLLTLDRHKGRSRVVQAAEPAGDDAAAEQPATSGGSRSQQSRERGGHRGQRNSPRGEGKRGDGPRGGGPRGGGEQRGERSEGSRGGSEQRGERSEGSRGGSEQRGERSEG